MRDASFRYRVVDVFTEQCLEGNALAVFPSASEMDEVTMQQVARELNLTETAFILPSARGDCVARVRIFTPVKEMLFAGHPTISAGFVLLDEGAVAGGAFVLEEAIGPVTVRAEPGNRPLLWLKTPRIEIGRTFDRSTCATNLGLDVSDLLDISPQLLGAGNPTMFVGLHSKSAVDRAWLDLAGMREATRKDV